MMAERKPVTLWDDVASWSRAPDWEYVTTWRGCRAAIQWTGDDGYRPCAVRALQQYGFCRKHAEWLGLLTPLPDPYAPRNGIPGAVRNTAIRGFRKMEPPMLTVADARRLTDDEITGWRNVGRVYAAQIRTILDTWSDDDLVAEFGLRRSEWDGLTFGDCNWVGEAVPFAEEAIA